MAVNPENTSQLCSGCGELVKKSLAQRVHSCKKCGLVIDRDVNAAKNILARVGPADAKSCNGADLSANYPAKGVRTLQK